jgi:hypothetical protein
MISDKYKKANSNSQIVHHIEQNIENKEIKIWTSESEIS